MPATTVPADQPPPVVSSVDDNGHSKVALFVLVPVLFVLVVICVVLTIFIYLSIRKRQNKLSPRYQSVSTKDDETVRKVHTLPFPPSVKISSSAYPSMEYSLATQLPQPLEVSSARYPFIQHQLPGPQGSLHEKRPPRLRTKRRGNHKHIRGKHVVLGGKQETIDSDHSPTPPESAADQSNVRIAQIPPKRDSSPEDNPNGSRISRPEVTLVFKHSESEATLIIIVNRVVNLPLRSDGTEVDGYVRLHFTPALPGTMDVRTTRTQTRRKNSSPIFQEELTYTNINKDDLQEMTLHIEVMDYKSYGKHNVLVQTEVEMRKVKFFDGNSKLTLPLEPPKVNSITSTLCVIVHVSCNVIK